MAVPTNRPLPPAGVKSSAPAARPAPSLPAVDTVAGLVAAREAAGMSTGDIISLLKLAPRQVAALESGDWAALPGLAFVRGTLRSYGRVVGVNVDALLAGLDDGAKAAELRASTSLQEPLPTKSMLGFGSGGSGSKSAWLLLGAVLLIALALFFARDSDFSRIPSLLKPGAATSPDKAAADSASAGGSKVESIAISPQTGASASDASVSASVPGAASSARTSSASTAPASTSPIGASPIGASSAGPQSATSPVLATSPALVASPAPATSPALATSAGASAPGGLRLVFERDSWVEIKQTDGKVLLYGQQKAGSEAQMPFNAEVSLTIGNAEFVKLERDGKSIDLKVVNRQGVARLKLKP